MRVRITRWEAGPGAVIAGRDIIGPVITGPVTYYAESFDRLQDAIFDPRGLYEELDLARFQGRKDLIKRIDAAIADMDRGYVVIRGEAGVGKSALAAHLVWTRPCVYHFTRLEGGARIPVEARRSLAAQLILAWGLADQFTPGGNFPRGADRPDWLLKVIHAAAEARNRDPQRQGRPIVLVVDGLDEAEADPPGMSTGIPLGLPRPESLPTGVYVVATGRFGIGMSPFTTSRSCRVEIEVEGEENLADMHAYLTRVLTGPNPDLALTTALAHQRVNTAWFIQVLMRRCHGVWIYLRYVLDEIRTGNRAPHDVASLPAGLRGYYLQQIHRWANRNRHQWQQIQLPVLATLAALHRSATADELVVITGLEHAHDEIIDWLTRGLRPFLNTTRTPTGVVYVVRHQSLRDLFTTPDIDETELAITEQLHRAWKKAHTYITHHLTPPTVDGKRDWTGIDEYTRIHIADHAAHAGLLDQLAADPAFLTAVPPWTVLRNRNALTTDQTRANATALELAANSNWESIPTIEERQWQLYIWARKTRNHVLAESITTIHSHWPWILQTARWAGTTHRTLTGHKGAVTAAAAVPLPDGQVLIATGSHDDTVRLWNPITGQQVGQPLTGHTDSVLAVTAVPLPDGRTLIATGSNDRTVRLWNPITGRQIGQPLTGHKDAVLAVTAVSLATGRVLVASSGGDATVWLWDPTTDAPANEPLIGHKGAVLAVTAVPLPDGRTLIATGSNDRTVRLWNPITGRQIGQPLTGHERAVTTVAAVLLPDGRTLLATGSKDTTVRLWDPVTGRQIGQPLTGHKDAVLAVAAIPLPDGQVLIATGGYDTTIRLWNPITGCQIGQPLTGHTDWVNAVAAVPLSDEPTLIATGSDDVTIRLWDPTTATQIGKPLIGHEGTVLSAAAIPLPDRRVVIATGGSDTTVRLWDPTTATQIGEPLTGHEGWVSAVAAVPLPDGRVLIASGSYDATVRLWDPTTGHQIGHLTGHNLVYSVAAIPLPDGRTLLATGGLDAKIRLWDPTTGAQIGAPLTGHQKTVRAIAAVPLPNGHTLIATGSDDRTVRLWNPITTHQIGQPLTGHEGWIRAMAAAQLADGRTCLVTGGDDRAILVWAPQAWNSALAPRRNGD